MIITRTSTIRHHKSPCNETTRFAHYTTTQIEINESNSFPTLLRSVAGEGDDTESSIETAVKLLPQVT
jgi:hypothetical protein